MLVARASSAASASRSTSSPRSTRLHGVEPARQQDLVDQRVELGDVVLELALAHRIGALLHELDRHADARERRAQLVRGVREQELVRADQLARCARRRWLKLSARRATSSRPSTLHPGREIAFAQRGRRRAAGARAAGSAAARPDTRPPRWRRRIKARTKTPKAGPPRYGARAASQRPSSSRAAQTGAPRRPRWRPARCGESIGRPTSAVRVPSGANSARSMRRSRARRSQRRLLLGRRRCRPAAARCARPSPASRRSTGARPKLCHSERRNEREHREAGQHGEIDAQVQPAH